ncbi:MAG: efflux RND transporter periplasmic adaptor subunit, partial [Planctomycetes bacterium]|nr:efflux RND transporter periplasmic adaptor subunit [Planctomycetota bacterium]
VSLLRISCLILALAACQRQDAAALEAPAPTRSSPLLYSYPAESLARTPLAKATAELRPLRSYCEAPARVGYDEDATTNVGAALSGRVVTLAKRVGDTVAAGDVLAELDSLELGEVQNELLLQRRTEAANAPLVALLETSWRSAERLHAESQGIALTEVHRREAEFRAAAAELRLASAGAAAAINKLTLFGMTPAAIDELQRTGALAPRQPLRAPRAGTVVARHATIGDLVDAEHGALFTLADLGALWVVAEVPERHVGGLALGSTAEVRLLHAPQAEVRGTVAFVAPALDPTTHTAHVRVVVTDPPAELRPGMFCEVRLLVDAKDGGAPPPQLAVPDAAVQLLDGHSVVFVPHGDSGDRFAARQVEVGEARDGFVPIRAGLTAGEVVVSDGSFLVKAQALTAAGGEEN